MKAILLMLGALSAAIIFVGCGTAVGRATGVDEKPPALDDKAKGSMAFSAADIQKIVDTAITEESGRQDKDAARAEEVRRQEEEEKRQEQLRAEEERRQEEEAERNREIARYEECAEQYQYPPLGFTGAENIASRSFFLCLRDGEVSRIVSVDRLESDWERSKLNAETAERERLLTEKKILQERFEEEERRREEQRRIDEENYRRAVESLNYRIQAQESAIETCETETREIYIHTILEAQEGYSGQERDELVREIFQECINESPWFEDYEIEFDPDSSYMEVTQEDVVMACAELQSPLPGCIRNMSQEEPLAPLAEQAEELAEEEAPVDGTAEERIAALEERVAELTELIRDLTEALQSN